MKTKNIIIPITMTTVIILSLIGCTDSQKQNQTETSTDNSAAQSTTQAADKSTDDMFTDRDYRTEYDESSAVKIELSDTDIKCESENVEISENTAVIKSEGTYIISGSISNGQIAVATDKLSKVQLVLDNADIDCDTSAAIYIKQADKVFITMSDGSKNTLSTRNDFIATDDNNIDAVIFSKANITLNGNGELEINTDYGHGIASKGDLKITSGTYSIDAKKHALQGKDSVRIADGTLNLTTEKDAISSENNDDDNTENKGFAYIIGGNIHISTDKNAIHTGKALTIKGGIINIPKCAEGLEGETINISGGEITIKASDDGINAASSENTDSTEMDNPFASDDSCSIHISGGKIKIDADGDGIDSNGNITVTGGETYIEGPENDGDGALDYNGTAVINGGTFIAIGSSGMAQNFSDSSQQGAMLVNISGSEGDEITLCDTNDNQILSYITNKKYSCAVISCPDIKVGETYNVKSGSQSVTVEMSNIIYGDNAMPTGGGIMNNPNRNREPMGGAPNNGDKPNNGNEPMNDERPTPRGEKPEIPAE